jgi:hypothetical protein
VRIVCPRPKEIRKLMKSTVLNFPSFWHPYMAIFVLGNLTNVVQENIMAFRKVDAIVTKIFTKLGARMCDINLNICL